MYVFCFRFHLSALGHVSCSGLEEGVKVSLPAECMRLRFDSPLGRVQRPVCTLVVLSWIAHLHAACVVVRTVIALGHLQPSPHPSLCFQASPALPAAVTALMGTPSMPPSPQSTARSEATSAAAAVDRLRAQASVDGKRVDELSSTWSAMVVAMAEVRAEADTLRSALQVR